MKQNLGEKMFCYVTTRGQSTVVVRIRCSGRGLHYQLMEPPKVQKEKGTAMSAALIGSRPPRCEGKCALCGRCEAVQVPVAPQDKRAFGDSVDESSTNYKPLNWKCKCADRRILNP